MTAAGAVGPAPAARAPARTWPGVLGLLGAVALAAGLLLIAALPLEVRLVAALALFVALPGHLFVQAVFPAHGPGRLERGLLALGGGFVLATLLGLALHAVFRPLAPPHLLVGGGLLDVGLLAAALARRADLRPRLGWPAWPLLLLLAVAAPLRLYNLGHSEFQGDEALVALRAAALLQGMPDALIAHRKPPGEILVAAVFAGGLDGVTELVGRLPFALAGLAGVVALYQLGRAAFGPRAGLAAGLLIAVNGFFVAFGRIEQYQGLALLLDALAILCLFRFAREPVARRGYAAIGGLLLAGSALMALSAVFLLPVAALALGRSRLGPERASWRQLLIWLWPLALVVPAAVAVYLVRAAEPGVLDPASALTYIGPRLGSNRPYFNLSSLLVATNLYTSSLYLAVTLGAGLLVLLEPLYERYREVAERLRRPAPAALLALDTRHLTPALLLVGSIAAGLGSPRRSLGWKLALAWLAGPLVTHLFLVRIVATHWREIFPGLALLLGAAAAGLYDRHHGRPAGRALLLLGTLFLAASAHYVAVAWVQPWPEYQLLYPRYRHPLDWSSQQERGAGGTFGAAHRHGWKVAGALVASGELPAAYATNERPAEAAWYLKQRETCDEAARLYIRAARSRGDRAAVEQGQAPPGFSLFGRVLVDGRPSLALFVRGPVEGPPRIFRDEDFDRVFDAALASPWSFPVERLYRPEVNAPSCP